MAREVICQYCKSQSNKVDKDVAIRVDEKNFHPECAVLYADRKQLYGIICRIFKLKAPGPRNNAYISKFLGQGMTYKGMSKALVYFYEVKKNSIAKSDNGVGIIPWVYEEANKYYERKEKMEKELKEAIEYSKNHQEVKQETRKVKMPEVTGPKVNIKTYSKEEFEW